MQSDDESDTNEEPM